MTFQPGQQLGSYRLVRLLGAGAMGEVYEAEHVHIARQVALKVLHPQLARLPEVSSRFLNEARAVNIVRHPGLVQISDVGMQPDGTTYIVMEYLAGETLGKYLERHGRRLPVPQVLNFAQQIAQALAAAHEKQIVHRDLKPDNIMLVREASFPGQLRLKLLDFGIAKVGRENQPAGEPAFKTQVGSLLGSPLYMSPEQCRGAETVGPPADVYGLGVILYLMLSGEPPFQGSSLGVIVGLHMFEKPVPIADKVPLRMPQLAALVDSMLHKDPAQRPTMPQIVRELERCQGELPEQRPGGRIFFRRLAVGVGSALVSLGVLWVVLSTSGMTGHLGARSCNAAGFCSEPLPAGIGRLRSIAALSEGDLWACGDPGVLLHYSGQQWQLVHKGLGNRLHQIFGLSASELWAVGDSGTVLHYDGKSWQQMPGISPAYLTGIWGPKADDLWMVGKTYAEQGTLLHYDGKHWQPMQSGTTQTLLSIWGTRSDCIWAAGNQGTLVHYDGAAWREVSGLQTSAKLTQVFGSGEKDVWVVGHGGTALHWDGQAWKALDTGRMTNINGGWSGGAGDVWLVGDLGLTAHYDGAQLVPMDSGVTSNLSSGIGLRGDQGTHLWAVGAPATLIHRLHPKDGR